MDEGWEPLPIGKGEVLRQGDDLLIVGYGHNGSACSSNS